MPLESSITRAIIRAAQQRGCYTEKRYSGGIYGVRGRADLYILVPVPYQAFAVALHVEVKQPGTTKGRKGEALQHKRLRDLVRAKAVALIVTEVAEVIQVIDDLQANGEDKTHG